MGVDLEALIEKPKRKYLLYIYFNKQKFLMNMKLLINFYRLQGVTKKWPPWPIYPFQSIF